MKNGSEKKYLECGKIVNTHGVKGAVKIESWCDSPEILADLPCLYFKKNDGYEKREVLSASVMKRHVIATLEGVSDVDVAMLLKETVVYAERDDIPLEEGDYFIIDLVGLPVIDVDYGTKYGTVSVVFYANNGYI